MDTTFKIRYTDTTYVYPKHDFGGNLNVGDHVRLTDGKYYEVVSKTLDIAESSWIIVIDFNENSVENL